ncbi:MAG: hypothetical protein PHU14_06565 [Methylovulum sp.]|nr:hypothetical protein [Methylovulum sp.]
MNTKERLNLSDENYNLLFDIRRSIRYHERRMAFFYFVQNVTNFFTLLMVGVVVMDFAKEGKAPEWMVYIGVVAALLSALDLVIGLSKRSALHSALREKFANLEIEIISGPPDTEVWSDYLKQRLIIEKDEPAIYYAIDGLCRNELLIAEGFSPKKPDDIKYFAKIGCFHRMTSQFLRWENTFSF